jgi:uracil-DNA glycosylase family protein
VEDASGTAISLIPSRPSLPKLRAAAAQCKACDLWRDATQTVFGQGRSGARILLVGEQPGDREDREGLPFVGPAGGLLDRALAEAGIDRNQTYVTNAVKHFKWEARGKKRIHKKPRYSEIRACRPWLEAEIAVVKPEVVVCLGATAAQTLLGRDFSVTRRRGEVVKSEIVPGMAMMATVHPSSILRAPGDAARHEQFHAFVNDLKKVAQLLRPGKTAA